MQGENDLLTRLKLSVMSATPSRDYEAYGHSPSDLHRFAGDADSGVSIYKGKDGKFNVSLGGVHVTSPHGGFVTDHMGRIIDSIIAAHGLTEQEAKGFASLLMENPDVRSQLARKAYEQQEIPDRLTDYVGKLVNKGGSQFSQAATPKQLSPGDILLDKHPEDMWGSRPDLMYDKGDMRSLLETTKFSDHPGLKFTTQERNPAEALPDVYYHTDGRFKRGFDMFRPGWKNTLFGSGRGYENSSDGLEHTLEYLRSTTWNKRPPHNDLVPDEWLARQVRGGIKPSFRDHSLVRRLSDNIVDKSTLGGFLRGAYVPSKRIGMVAGLYSNLRAMLGDDVSNTEKAINGAGTLAATAPAIASKVRDAKGALDLISRLGSKVKNPKLKAIASVAPEAVVGALGFAPFLYGGSKGE